MFRLVPSVRRLGFALLMAVLLLTGTSPTSLRPAAAVEGPMEPFFLGASRIIREGSPVRLVSAPEEVLREGDRIFLQGRLAATNSNTRNVGQVAEIQCRNAQGELAQNPVRATRNHEGSDFPYSTPGQLHVLVDYTFIASEDNTYTCHLYATSWTDADPNLYYLTAVPTETRLYVSVEEQPDAQFRVQEECDSGGVATSCLYIGAPGHDDTTFPLYTGMTSEIFTMDPAAETVEARGVLQMTSCNLGTASCIDAVDQYGEENWSTVRLYLELIQLTAQGTTCDTFRSRPDGDPRIITIGRDAHHYPATEIVPPVTPNPNCPRDFIVRFRVAHGSGAPVKIAGLAEGFIQTNASIFNLGV